MQGNVKNFFPGANTYQGFYSFFTYLGYKTKRVYIIKGGPGTGKSTLMKKIGTEVVKIGYDIEKHRCASDPESLDGLVIPDLKIAILDGTAPHTVEPEYPGVVEEIINFGEFWNSNYLINKKNDIINLSSEIKECFAKAYHYLKLAFVFNNEIEYTNQQGFNSEIANNKAQMIIRELFESSQTKPPSSERHLFASGITPGGLINYLDNITEDCSKRYLLTGEPGTGKSTLTKKIAATASSYGYETLYLHCSLDPKSLDSLVIPKLRIAVVNNTFPHTIKESKQRDIIINMMECISNKKIQENNKKENIELYKRYLNKAMEQLKKEKKIHDELEKYYVKAMNFKRMERKRQKLLHEIMSFKVK